MYRYKHMRGNCCLHWKRGRCGRDHMVVGFTTTCEISAYDH